MNIFCEKELPNIASRDKDGIKNTQRILRFKTENLVDSALILNHPEIPKANSRHPRINGYFCKDVDLSIADDDGRYSIYLATCSYSNNASETTDVRIDFKKKPWEQPPIIDSFTPNDIVVPMKKAYNNDDEQGKPTKDVLHPVTKEPLLAETVESIINIKFTYNLKKFKYSWLRKFKNTMNKEAVTLLGVFFPAKTLKIKNISPKRQLYTNNNGSVEEFFNIAVEIEDYGKEITNELGLLGFLMSGKNADGIVNIQLKDGEYDNYDQEKTELNIQSARLVSKETGKPLSTKTTEIGDEYYETFQDCFEADWKVLDLPKKDK